MKSTNYRPVSKPAKKAFISFLIVFAVILSLFIPTTGIKQIRAEDENEPPVSEMILSPQVVEMQDSIDLIEELINQEVDSDIEQNNEEVELLEGDVSEEASQETVHELEDIVFENVSLSATLAATDTTYQGYSSSGVGFVLYVRPSGSTQVGDVAYCFNGSKNLPKRASASGSLTYTKLDATAQYLYDSADKPSPTGTTAQQFYDNIMKVLYYGYPNNKNLPDSENIQLKYNLDDEQFRYATQCAIWHYTNNYFNSSMSSDDITTMGGSNQPYLDLINNTGTVPADFSLHIYEPNDDSYQWLMSTDRNTDGLNTSIPQTYSLTVSKTVTGQGNKEEEFEMNIYLTDADGNPIAGDYAGSTTEVVAGEQLTADITFQFVNGILNINVVDGYSLTVKGLPSGYSYTVTENGASNYTTKINHTIDDDKSVSATNVTSDTTIIYENTIELTVPDNPVSTNGSLPIEKDFVMTSGAMLPEQTFTFTISPVDVTDGQTVNGLTLYDGVGEIQSTTISFDGFQESVEQSSNGVTFTGLKGNTTFSFADDSFTNEGVYRYQVKETAGTTAGITYDSQSYTVDVYVVKNENGGLEAKYVTVKNSQGNDSSVVFTNTVETKDVGFKKEVKGSGADPDQKFGFYVQVTDPENRFGYASIIPATIYNADGTFTTTQVYVGKSTYIYLTAGQTYQINLPVGMQLTASEDADSATGYSVKLTSPDNTEDADQQIVHTVSATDNNPVYTFTNTKEDIVPTGVNDSSLSFTMMLIAAMAGLGLMIYSKRISID